MCGKRQTISHTLGMASYLHIKHLATPCGNWRPLCQVVKSLSVLRVISGAIIEMRIPVGWKLPHEDSARKCSPPSLNKSVTAGPNWNFAQAQGWDTWRK